MEENKAVLSYHQSPGIALKSAQIPGTEHYGYPIFKLLFRMQIKPQWIQF